MTEQPWELYLNVVKVSSPIDLLMIHYPMYHKDNENQTTRWYSTSINNPTILIKCIAFPIHKMAWEAEQGDISERENESQEMRDGHSYIWQTYLVRPYLKTNKHAHGRARSIMPV